MWKTTVPSTRREFKLFSLAYGTVVEIGDMLGHRASCNGFKTLEIIQNIFFDHSELRLPSKAKDT